MKADDEKNVIRDGNYWIPLSGFTDRQDEVGRCAEINGGTDRCYSGRCELCNHCSLNPKRRE